MPLRICRSLALGLVVATELCTAAELYNNGPLITHLGAGFGGANVSAIQTTQGSQLPGYGIQFPGDNHIADDFTVPAGGWVIDTATLYTFQLNTGTTPTTWDIKCRIWSGKPGEAGSFVVWGNLTANRCLDSAFSGIYRASETDLLAQNRAIMVHSVSLGVSLNPGIYWMEWTAQGQLATGPWAPPVTRQGLHGNGNAIQFYGSDQQWHSAFDNGGSWTDDLPFALFGPSGGGQQNIAPNALSIGPGSVTSGVIGDLATSNETRMTFRPGAILIPTQRPLQITIEGTAPNATASQLLFVIESSATSTTINQQVEFYNFATNSYDAVSDSRTLQTVDQSVELVITGPNNHIGPGNKVRARISAKANGAVLSFPWIVRIDQAIWRYTP